MQNLKTGIVVALLLAVCYGAFKALNAPEPDLPPELAEWAAEGTDFDSLVGDIQVPDQSAKPKLESDISLPELSLPQSGLPQAELPQSGIQSQPKLGTPAVSANPTISGNPNTLTLGTLGSTQSLSQQSDGPSIKIPAPLDPPQAQESLVPDSLSQLPLDTAIGNSASSPTIQSNTTLLNQAPTTNSESTSSNDFPSIPLPGIMITAQKSDTLPMLEEAGKSTQASSQSNAQANATEQSNSPEQVVLEPFAAAREKALKQANDGKLKEALVALTPYYRSPQLSLKDYEDLIDILDALAREVIFSQRHLLKPAYTTLASDTLASVAAQQKVTPELLRSINQLGDTQALTQGQQLKVIEGPFRGEVDLNMGEMTLYLNDMYACRFPISVGTDYDDKVGKFEVAEKRTDRTYYGAGGKVLKAGDPSNPYGGYWIDLGGNCIHGSPEMSSAEKSVGCIGLAPIDASDVFIMLTVGSQVEFIKKR